MEKLRRASRDMKCEKFSPERFFARLATFERRHDMPRLVGKGKERHACGGSRRRRGGFAREKARHI